MKVRFQTSLQVKEENCVLLSCCAASSGNSLPTLRDKLSVPFSRFKKSICVGFLTLEDGNGRLSRNVDKELPLLGA